MTITPDTWECTCPVLLVCSEFLYFTIHVYFYFICKWDTKNLETFMHFGVQYFHKNDIVQSSIHLIVIWNHFIT